MSIDASFLRPGDSLPTAIQVAVRPGNSTGNFTQLQSRQPLTPTPYALLARDSVRLAGKTADNYAAAAHTHSAQDISTGILPAVRGGLGIDLSSAPAGSLLYSSAPSTWSVLPPGDNGQLISMTGSGLLGWASALNILQPGPGIALDPPADPSGRVKVKFHWDTSGIPDQANTWSRLQTFGAGVRYGVLVLPEVNDEVIVAFEHGDINRPVVVGTLYSTKDPPAQHGPSRKIRAGDAAGENGDGGNIILQPGRANGAGKHGRVSVATETLEIAHDGFQSGNIVVRQLGIGAPPAGTLRYDLATSQWEISNAEGPFLSIATRDSSGSLDADSLDGFSWHTHPFLQHIEPPTTTQPMMGTFPGLRLRGVLSDLSGQPQEGLVTVTARIYAQPEGGTPLYTETFTPKVNNGVFDVVLGTGMTSSVDLPSALTPPTGSAFERYLGLRVGDDQELRPRRRMTAGAYAVYAQNAATLGGQPASAYATQTDNNAEAAARANADTQLQANIDAEVLGRINADTTINSKIDSAVQRLDAADSGLRRDLQDVRTEYQDSLDAEQRARTTADTRLQSNINSEAQARTLADSQLQANIDAEAQARMRGEMADRSVAGSKLANPLYWVEPKRFRVLPQFTAK